MIKEKEMSGGEPPKREWVPYKSQRVPGGPLKIHCTTQAEFGVTIWPKAVTNLGEGK